eukprot:XP_764396.1 hypothetical protein [Theileria parva strain Muguga]
MHMFSLVWDSDEFEIAYSFSDLSNLVKSMTVCNQNSSYPQILAGLSCGSIVVCDTRQASASNFSKPTFNSPLTCIKSLKHNEHQLIATYDNSLMLVWDLRRFSKPLHKITNTVKSVGDPFIWGCTVNSTSQNSVARILHEKTSVDFKYEDDLWNYIRDHESGPKRSKTQSSPVKKNNFTDPTVKYRRVLSSDHSVNYKRYLDDKLVNYVKYTNGDLDGFEKEYKSKTLRKRVELNMQHAPTNLNPDNSSSLSTKTLPTDKRSEVCTDLQISDYDFNIYVAHKDGIIECYNSNTFKLLKSINVKEFESDLLVETKNSRDQKMKIQLVCEDSVLAFTNMNLVGFVNLRNDQLIKYIDVKQDDLGSVGPEITDTRWFFHDVRSGMDTINENRARNRANARIGRGGHGQFGQNQGGNQLDIDDQFVQEDALVRELHFERQRQDHRNAATRVIDINVRRYASQPALKDLNIKDISTVPSIREIYATNGSGQLFEIHTGTT